MNNPHNGDRTIMVPTPGAAGAAPSPLAGFAPMPNLQEGMTVNDGLNPLANAASTLLTVAIKLRTTMSHSNVPDLHRRLTEEIKAFENTAKNTGSSPEIVLSARYLLCTVVDEIVLNTPWGTASGWSQHSLLSLFHKETAGGEKCFAILQRMLETPGRHLDILELYYLCLSLGFQGKYRLIQRGHEQLEQIRDSLYQTIENHREPMERDLSPHWQGCVERKKGMINYIPMWVIASIALLILVLSYSGFRWWLYDSTAPVAERIEMLTTPKNQPLTEPLDNQSSPR